MPKLLFDKGLKKDLPTLDVAQPAFTTDTEEVFIGSGDGNIQLVKQSDLTDLLEELAGVNANAEVLEARGTYPVLGDRLEQFDNSVGDVSILPSALQESLAFAVKAFYDSMTEINVCTPPYNLKNDGTDVTADIQTLFNLARDNGRVKLRFPNGTYAISNYIQVYKNTVVMFDDGAVMQRIGTYYKMFVNGDLSNKSYVTGGGYTGEGNIHFVGGTFDLNCQAGNTSGISPTQTVSFFDLLHAEDISFDRITVKNGQIGHYFQVSSCKNVSFRDCWFGAINYTGDGTNFDYECIQIEVATSDSDPDFGNYDLTISRDIFIENCTFDTVIRAVGTHSDAQYGTSNTIFCENLKFINNKIFNSYDHAINLTGERYATVKNNIIIGAGSYGMKLYKVEDSEFHNNTFINVQRAGIYVDTSHNNKFKDNVLKEVSITTEVDTNGVRKVYAGFRLVASMNNVFDDNTVTAVTPQYSYALYTSGGCPNTRVKGYNFTRGLSGTIGGEFTMSNNLSWCSVGDSITAGNINSGGYYQDHAIPLLSKVNTTYRRGYPGYCASIPGTVGAYSSIHDVINDVEVADIYTVFLGTNDYSHNVPVGTSADSTGKTDSFWGGLKQLYVDLTAKNMNATIIMITPIKRTSTPTWDSTNTTGVGLSAYVQAVKDFASQYGCPVLDLFNDSGISNRTAPTFLSDGTHPTLETNKRIGKIIGNKINQYI